MPTIASIALSGVIMPQEWDWWDEGCISMKGIQTAVGALPAFDELSITIDTIGGVMEEGWKIYDYLKALGKPIHFVGMGTVYSMGTVLFSLGITRQLSPHTKFMAHLPSGEGWGGNRIDIQEYLDLLIAEEQQMLEVYAAVTGKDESVIAELLADGKDHYFTAAEAVAYGWATGIYQANLVTAQAGRIRPNQRPVFAKLKDGRKGLGLTNVKPTSKINMASLTETFNDFLAKVSGIVVGKPTALSVTTADGQTLTIDTGDRTDYAVGDAVTIDGTAAADGDYILSDNATITVADGVITIITPAPVDEDPADETVTISKAEHDRLLALDTKVTALESQVAAQATEQANVTALMERTLASLKSVDPAPAPKVAEPKPLAQSVDDYDPVAAKLARKAAKK